LTGMFNKRSEDDELMLKCIGETNPHTDQVLVIDARSKVNAQCNRVIGGGYEHSSYYPNCDIYFGGIDNIHGVRDAYQKCFPIWRDQWECKNYDDIMSKIITIKWKELLQTILKVACLVSETMIIDQKNVLVH